MTKSFRLISRLEIKGLNVVKGINMEGLRVVDFPEKLARKYFSDGIDEIILSDIVASLYGRNHLFKLVEKVSKEVSIPIVAGGGIRSINDIDMLLKSGADKISINTHAVKNPKLIKEAALKFGSQCIIVEIHAKFKSPDNWQVLVENGREPTSLNLVKWIKKVEELGAGEILLISVDKDGTFKGLDKNLINLTFDKVSIPIIYGGGFNDVEEIKNYVEKYNIDAVSISHALHFNKFKIGNIKKELIKSKIEVRPFN